MEDLSSKDKIKDLSSKDKTKDLWEASYMGFHITRHREKKLKSDHHLYAQTITDRFEINKININMVPATVGVKPLSKEVGSQTPEKEEKRGIPYREAVGALEWVSTTIRPKISSCLERHQTLRKAPHRTLEGFGGLPREDGPGDENHLWRRRERRDRDACIRRLGPRYIPIR